MSAVAADAPLPMCPRLVLVGLRLADMRDHLGRVPTATEIQRAFRCSRATSERYLAAMLRKRRGHRLPGGSAATRARRHGLVALPAPTNDAEAKLMAEFGFSHQVAAEVAAYDRGEALPE